jgi:hypothetical protein
MFCGASTARPAPHLGVYSSAAGLPLVVGFLETLCSIVSTCTSNVRSDEAFTSQP